MRDSNQNIVDEQKIIDILDGDSEKLVSYAEELGFCFAPQNPSKKEKDRKLSSSQIRNILDMVQRMKAFDRNQLLRLRPKLAYTAGKSLQENSIRELQLILDKAIQETNSPGRFSNFKDFFEAIVGYHRYHSKIREA